MSVLPIGLGLWALSLVLLFRVVRLAFRYTVRSRVDGIIWCVLICGAVVLLFRPHEDIFGGQDPGSYLNSAVSYARHNKLFYRDELLAQVPTDERHLFLYGHAGFRLTKGACLWIRDMEKAIVGPWFQPAYPVLMSLVAMFAPDRFVLYVAPLFTLFAAMAIAVLCSRLFRHRFAYAAGFLFYVLNPNTVWHGRCPRAEAVASFMVLGAWLLLFETVDRRGRMKAVDAVVASVLLGTAPFFHITSWMAVVPAGCWMIAMAATGRCAFLAFPPVAVISLLVLVYQCMAITDPYGIAPSLQPLKSYPLVASVVAIFGYGVLVGVSVFMKRRLAVRPAEKPTRKRILTGNGLRWALGLLLCAALLALHFRFLEAGERLRGVSSVVRYLRLTDVRGAVVILSRGVSLLALVGCFALVAQGGETWPKRIALVISLAPAALLVGKMPHFMYFSRRIQPFFIPLFVLSLVALVAMIPNRRRLLHGVFAVLTLGIAALGVMDRRAIFTLTEDKGFVSFLSGFAGEIKANDGILLCEYSRIAAPFDHFFGIPTLGIDHQRRSEQEYAAIMKRWQHIMEANPGRPGYFITPFTVPVDNEYVRFTPVAGRTLGQCLLETGPALPRRIRTVQLGLHLCRTEPIPREQNNRLDDANRR